MDIKDAVLESIEKLRGLYVQDLLNTDVVDGMSQLGILPKGTSRWATFEGAREFAHTLNLPSSEAWLQKAQEPGFPYNIPHKPDSQYAGKGWKGWDDFLGKDAYCSYEEACLFAWTLKLESVTQWRRYCAGKCPHLPPKPDTIPSSVHIYYAPVFKWQYFLGNESDINHSDSVHVSYQASRKFAHSLGLVSCAQWERYCRGEYEYLPNRPSYIPRHPRGKYKPLGHWKGWDDFLGFADKFSWEEAQEYVQSLGICTQRQWEEYRRGEIEGLDPDEMSPRMPPSPAFYYANLGIDFSWPVLFGTSDSKPYSRKNRLSYVDARAFAHTLSLKNPDEWLEYIQGKFPDLPQKPLNIPKHPNRIYKEFDWYDFLGCDPVRKNKSTQLNLCDLEQFRDTYSLQDPDDWRVQVIALRESSASDSKKLGYDMPLNIDQYLKSDCFEVDFYTFFSIDRVRHQFNNESWREYLLFSKIYSYAERYSLYPFDPQKAPSYLDLKNVVSSLKLASDEEWHLWYSGSLDNRRYPNHERIPQDPSLHYEEFEDWITFLGAYIPFDELRKYARTCCFTTMAQWNSHVASQASSLPSGKYKRPNMYSDWNGPADFLGSSYAGIKVLCKSFYIYVDARSYVHSLGLKSRNEWNRYASGHTNRKRPEFIPNNPEVYYGKDFVGWHDWLGPSFAGYQRIEIWPYEKAQKFISSFGFKSKAEFFRFRRDPEMISRYPDLIYIYKDPQVGYKDKGWYKEKGWAHFLGK